MSDEKISKEAIKAGVTFAADLVHTKDHLEELCMVGSSFLLNDLGMTSMEVALKVQAVINAVPKDKGSSVEAMMYTVMALHRRIEDMIGHTERLIDSEIKKHKGGTIEKP